MKSVGLRAVDCGIIAKELCGVDFPKPIYDKTKDGLHKVTFISNRTWNKVTHQAHCIMQSTGGYIKKVRVESVVRSFGTVSLEFIKLVLWISDEA
jgi:hypothetical protein